MHRAWEYIRAFGSDWITLMGGVGALIFTAVGTIWSVPAWVFWGIGAILFVVTFFRVWLNERKAVEQLQGKLQSIEKTPSVLSDLFIVRHTEHKLGIREQNGGFGWLDPTVKPEAGTLCLQVQVLIQASSVLVENIELKLMGKRLPSDWESRKVELYLSYYVYFDIPEWVSFGSHKVKLIAWGLNREVNSQEFEIDVPQQA